MNEHNMFEHVDQVSRNSQKGALSSEEINKYKKLDDSITKAMLAAERRLPHHCELG